jgi:hypothetical protein
MTMIGSQIRETLAEAGIEYYYRSNFHTVVLLNDGKFEIWFRNNNHAGYTIEVEGVGYEFGCSLSPAHDPGLHAKVMKDYYSEVT